jgi:O-antigen/teichoic acid export membrane protein
MKQIIAPRSGWSHLKVWIWRGSAVSIAPLVDVALRFGRTAILSRLLVPSELGIAVAFTVVVATAGLVTDMGYDKFLMTKSHDAHALNAVHVLSLIRGLFLACLLFLAAPTIAASFGVPELADSFAVLSFVPLLSSLAHLGIRQVEGSFEYAPEMRAQLVAASAAFILVLPAAYMLKDHRAMLICLVAQPAIYSVVSHILARNPYRLSASPDMLRVVLSYGIPLTVNGLGLALVSQFDRALVGHWFDVSTLALYAILLNLMGVPISLMDRIFGKIALSYLVTSQAKQGDSREKAYPSAVFPYAVLASTYSLFIAVAFDLLVPIIFGHHFHATPNIHVLIAARVFFLVQINGAPTMYLFATGRTRALTVLSLSSGIGLLFAAFLVRWWPSIEAVLLGLLLGDILRFVLYFIFAASRKTSREIWADLALSAVTVTGVVSLLVFHPEPTMISRGTILAVGVLGICVQIGFGLRRHSAVRNLFVSSY